MKNIVFLVLLFVISSQIVFGQWLGCSVENLTETSGAKRVTSSYSITSFLDTQYSTMRYCSNLFNHENGGNFYLDYADEGGSGMDAYPNVSAGGVKSGGVWYPGDKNVVGMPVNIDNLSETLNFEWETHQENAWDGDDKWMASVNFIFDNYGDETSMPVNADRDYDLVVMHESHNFNEDFNDLSLPNVNRLWYFAREVDGSLKPYELNINGVVYKYAVRYKFFTGTVDKDNKAHVKFIPYGLPKTPPVLKINIKEIIQVSKNYIEFASMPDKYRELAMNNIALDNAWLKSINAGYEVYTGQSVLKIDKFKVNLLSDVSAVKNYDVSTSLFNVYPNPSKGFFYLELNSKVKLPVNVNIYSISGTIVENLQISNIKTSINLQYLVNGLYMIVVHYDHQLYKQKLLIRK